MLNWNVLFIFNVEDCSGCLLLRLKTVVRLFFVVQMEAAVQWLNEAVILFTLALQQCQQLADKVATTIITTV